MIHIFHHGSAHVEIQMSVLGFKVCDRLTARDTEKQ